MGKTCLVTGKSGPLLAEIVHQGAGRERDILVTRSGHMELGEVNEERTSVIAWNRRSALSARSVVLHTANVFGNLDEAIVVFAPTEESATFHESSIVSIEDRIDADVKGYIYILREILARLVKQGSGTLTLLMQHPPEELLSPLEAAAVGSFSRMTEALSRYYQNEPVDIHRFRSERDDAAAFATFVLDRLDALSRGPSGIGRPGGRGRRTTSRWISYPRRPHFFSRRNLR